MLKKNEFSTLLLKKLRTNTAYLVRNLTHHLVLTTYDHPTFPQIFYRHYTLTIIDLKKLLFLFFLTAQICSK